MTGRVVAFLIVADFMNWNSYYAESKEIVNVHNLLKEEMEK